MKFQSFFKYTELKMIAILILGLCISVARSTECIPEQTTLYWKSPCDGQTFTNTIIPTNVTVTQDGQAVDDRGGLDLEIPIDIVADIMKNYGEVATPLVDLAVFEYAKSAGQCKWSELPTFGLLDNIDACTMIDNCHLYDDPSTIHAVVDVKALAGSLLHLVDVGSYYRVQMTFKDNKQPTVCLFIQDVVINV